MGHLKNTFAIEFIVNVHRVMKKIVFYNRDFVSAVLIQSLICNVENFLQNQESHYSHISIKMIFQQFC